MHSSPDQPGRRGFFVGVLSAIQAVIGGTIGVILGGAIISPGFGRRQENWLPAASLNDLPEDQPTPVTLRITREDGYTQVVDRRTVFLVRTGDSQIAALDSTCTHLGCRVSWDKDAMQFRCPCHGGRYDASGKVVSGPPPAPLARFTTKIDGGQVLVQV